MVEDVKIIQKPVAEKSTAEDRIIPKEEIKV